MKRVVPSVFLAVSIAFAAQADPFQLIRKATGGYASGAAIYLNGKLLGYTDDYERIIIELPAKTYTVDVSFLGQTTKVVLTVTGNSQLQVVKF